MYDYIGHLQKFGFEWNHTGTGFRYRIEINNNKLKKYIFLSKTTTKNIQTDISRVWNMDIHWKEDDQKNLFKKRINFLLSLFYYDDYFKKIFKIGDGASKNLKTLTIDDKMKYIFQLSKHLHKDLNINEISLNNFYTSIYSRVSPLIHFDPSNGIRRYTNRIQRLLVPKFFHDRKDNNFLKHLIFVGEKQINEKGFSDVKELGRKLYEYRANNKNQINIGRFDLPFPDKYYDTIGFTVNGFLFTLKNLSDNLKTILNPSNDLINIERGGEEVENTLTKDLFYDIKKIKEKIKEYN